MKRLLTVAGMIMVMVMCTATAFSQIIAVNGTNTPEVLVPEVREYIVEMTVDTFGLVVRDDKYKGDNAPQQDLNNIIALHNELQAEGKHLAVCFTLYTRDSNFNVANGIEDLDALINAGVLIYSIRFGNEEWAKEAGHGGKKGGDFDAYWNLCSQYLSALTQRGMDRVLIPLERPSEDLTWNTNGAQKINSDWRFQPDYHPYWGPNQAGVLDSLKKETLPVANPIGYLAFHDWFYMTLYDQVVLGYDLIGEIRAWHEANVPGKEWHITEVGPPTAVGHISNAIGFDATTDWFFNAIKAPDVKFVARFNGPSPTGTAIISPKSKKDAVGLSAYVKRLGYYTMYNHLRNTGALVQPDITQPGTYTVSIHNLTRDQKAIGDYYTLRDVQLVSQTFTGIWGKNYYSGSGAIEWWSKDSPKVYEVAGIATSDIVPALSYGYATVTVEAIPKPVECLRKRWLFQSLPCRPVKTNCNCDQLTKQ